MDISSDQLVEQISPPATAETTGQPSLNPLRLLVGIFIRPRATFDKMRSTGRTYWWLVFVLMIAAVALLTYATETVRASMLQGFAFPEGFTPPDPSMMPEGTEMPAAASSSSTASILYTITTGVVGAFFGYLVSAFVIFGLGLVMGGKADLNHIFPVAVWATLPLVLRKFVHAVVSLVTGKTIVAGFSGIFTMGEAASTSWLYILLGQFDVYLVWSLLLLGIGVTVTSRLSKGKSAVIVLVYLAIGAGLLLASNWASTVLADLLGTNMRMPGMMGPGRRG